MSSKFEIAVKYVQGLDKGGSGPDASTKLDFYKYYKQANNGNADPAKAPSIFQFVERAKWDAWIKIDGMSKEVAKEKYVEKLVQYLKENHPDEPVLAQLQG